MYTIIEMQTTAGVTTVATPITMAERSAAEAEWYMIMARAAVSEAEIHSSVILNAEGYIIKNGCVKHQKDIDPNDK